MMTVKERQIWDYLHFKIMMQLHSSVMGGFSRDEVDVPTEPEKIEDKIWKVIIYI